MTKVEKTLNVNPFYVCIDSLYPKNWKRRNVLFMIEDHVNGPLRNYKFQFIFENSINRSYCGYKVPDDDNKYFNVDKNGNIDLGDVSVHFNEFSGQCGSIRVLAVHRFDKNLKLAGQALFSPRQMGGPRRKLQGTLQFRMEIEYAAAYQTSQTSGVQSTDHGANVSGHFELSDPLDVASGNLAVGKQFDSMTKIKMTENSWRPASKLKIRQVGMNLDKCVNIY